MVKRTKTRIVKKSPRRRQYYNLAQLDALNSSKELTASKSKEQIVINVNCADCHKGERNRGGGCGNWTGNQGYGGVGCPVYDTLGYPYWPITSPLYLAPTLMSLSAPFHPAAFQSQCSLPMALSPPPPFVSNLVPSLGCGYLNQCNYNCNTSSNY